ncbi:hypothetical protein [Solitalea canadensis]|uniref:Pre-toxin TG domain-containing protein n=1 Tax=Solitalea canadensis (strain ATCC 29591 / DSM 3403 / JCM 21819 / LMG 8368 / NBRC 15130 / NCIMB 12057 / USAM 9D) TaxID=929556 RepID=H8KV62_SOLCM|nr:hypothetical protein [Solitalea canadensis]AFD06062.1 hypothetical protein Solca_0950 [Solitalea canadensis DSM 3403]
MNQRLLKRKFLFLFFFALFTMITACEKDTIERHENPEKQIEKVRLDEITEWYSKTGSQWSKKSKLLYDYAQEGIVNGRYYIRMPLDSSYVDMYFTKEDGQIKGYAYKVYEGKGSEGDYSGVVQWYDFQTNNFSGVQLNEGKVTKEYTFEKTTTAISGKQTKNIIDRIWCWIRGGVYSDYTGICLEVIREHPVEDGKYGTAGAGNGAKPSEYPSGKIPEYTTPGIRTLTSSGSVSTAIGSSSAWKDVNKGKEGGGAREKTDIYGKNGYPLFTAKYLDASTGITYSFSEIETMFMNNPALVADLNKNIGDEPTINLNIVSPKYHVIKSLEFAEEAIALGAMNPTWTSVQIYSAALWNTLKGEFHFALDMVGMVPVVGEAADIVNGGIYFLEGDKINCALSAGAAIPVVGWTATAGKWTKNAVKGMSTTVSKIPNLNKAYKAVKNGRGSVRFIKLAVKSFSYNELKVLEAVKPADAKLTSIARWLLDQSALHIATTETALKNIVDDIVKNGDNVVNAAGKKTEALSDLIFTREGFTKQTSKLTSDNGFDGVFIKGTLDNPTEIIINEAKQVGSAGNIKLDLPNKGPQMSDAWIDATIKEMRSNADPITKKLGDVLLNNRNKIIKTVTGIDRSTGEILILKLKNYN